jgi:hypothetical protein
MSLAQGRPRLPQLRDLLPHGSLNRRRSKRTRHKTHLINGMPSCSSTAPGVSRTRVHPGQPTPKGTPSAVDPDRNHAPGDAARRTSPDGAGVAVLVVPTNEELEITRQTLAVQDRCSDSDQRGIFDMTRGQDLH